MRFGFWGIVFALCLAVSFPAWARVEKPVVVVTSFTILQDMVRQVGGDVVMVRSLVGPNGDPHTYHPTPDDAKAIATADLVVMNGLHFEGWMERLARSSGAAARVIVASEGVVPREIEGAWEKEVHSVLDAHAWQDVKNSVIYVRNIAAGLQKLRPEKSAEIAKRAAAYEAELVAMDARIREEIAKIPADRRKIITSHDAFGYFGAAYGVRFLSPVGISTESEPSASNIAGLIRQIKAEGVKRVFIENMTNPRLVSQIGRDTGARMGGELYADSLSEPSGPTPTYLDLHRHNLALMKAAME